MTLAISGTLSLGVVADASAAATVSYNGFNHDRSAPRVLVSGGNGTDGWMRTTANSCGSAGSTCGDGTEVKNNPNKVLAGGNAEVPWVGNDPRHDAEFGYIGTQTLNWTAIIGAGDDATVSRLDSYDRYHGTVLSDGTIFNYADIDTAKGAWHDNDSNGWRHDTDIGLFKSTVTQQVTLSISSLLSNGQTDQTPQYGFTIFEGMDAGSGNYNHHAAWHIVGADDARNVGNNQNPITESNPFGGTGLEVLVGDYVVGNTATFTAEAGKVYTIFLGGFQAGDWVLTRNDYQLSISSVPVPGAVWLFGSAMAGLVSLARRKQNQI